MNIQERIDRILKDQDFKNHCIKCKKSNPTFEEDFEIARKIAKIDINNIRIDESLIYLKQPFTYSQIEKSVLDFYGYLDKLTPGTDKLKDIVSSNSKYIVTDNKGDKNARSHCSYKELANGNIERKIFINNEGRIGDISNSAHENCHALSDSFIYGKPLKDKNMSEVTTVIVDALCNIYLQMQMPHLAQNFNENAINTQVLNVIKAREVLLDGLIIKVMTGEETFDNLVKNYGDMYLKNTRILERCLDKIETYQFSNMYEKRYLVPQAIALNMLDRFKTDPEKTVRQFKEVLAHDTEWTVEDTLDYLNLPPKKQLVDDYVSNYHTRMDKMQNFKDVTK